ncbi:MAG: hypothetical protein JXM70_14555 [Pirellulales bacterium]|nr:hypothetical protein [Pirellulales bacterium]
MRIFALLGLTLAMFMSRASTVGASTIVYTDKTAWENALIGQFLTEDFADDQLNTGVSFVSSESGHVNPAQENYQDVLTSESQNEPMTIWSFTPEITAYGGDWTLGGPGGSGNSLRIYLADSSLYVGTILNSYNGGFWGFISDTPFTSVKLIGGSGTNQQHYSLDDMVYCPVPDPVPGDASGDGIVDVSDLGILAAHYGAGGDLDWEQADFTEDGFVDVSDLGILAAWYGYGTIVASVPEPNTIALLLCGLASLLCWRSRK